MRLKPAANIELPIPASLSSGKGQRGDKGWSEPERTNDGAWSKIWSNVQELSRSSISRSIVSKSLSSGVVSSFDLGRSAGFSSSVSDIFSLGGFSRERNNISYSSGVAKIGKREVRMMANWGRLWVPTLSFENQFVCNICFQVGNQQMHFALNHIRLNYTNAP